MEDWDKKARIDQDPQTYELIGATMEVHRRLGSGFLESDYQDAMVIEMTRLGIPFVREASIEIKYRDVMASKYKADFICRGSIILELKAIAALTRSDEGQLVNYLKATGVSRGLLFNFGSQSLEFRRLIYTDKKQPPVSVEVESHHS